MWRRDQYKVGDLLSDLASGQLPGVADRKFLLDLADRIGSLDVRVKGSLASLAEKLRTETFTKEERRALFVVRSLIEWINPAETDPHDKAP